MSDKPPKIPQSQTRAKPGQTTKNPIPNRTSIHQRPASVATRQHAGHWEADFIICKFNRPLLVLHERKSRFDLLVPIASRKATEVINTIIKAMKDLSKKVRRSMTFDNDTGFARHAVLRQLLSMQTWFWQTWFWQTWFCDAYASWPKGGVENANGRIRRDLPRRTDLEKLTQADIEDIAWAHNLTPRKCLGFKTPFEAFLTEIDIHARISLNPGLALQN
jgi:IS30 family transposase